MDKLIFLLSHSTEVFVEMIARVPLHTSQKKDESGEASSGCTNSTRKPAKTGMTRI